MFDENQNNIMTSDIINQNNLNNNYQYNDISYLSEHSMQENSNHKQDTFHDPEQKNKLQNYVKEWLRYDDEIRTLQSAIKDRKNEKAQLGKIIMSFMDENDIPQFNLSDGKLIFSKSNHTEAINLKFIKSNLMDAPNISQDHYEKIMEYLESKRGKRTTIRLKRTKKHDK